MNHDGFIDLLGRPVPLVDPSFSFLTKSPEIQKIALLRSCNGLVLFGHRRVSDTYDSLGYIVCNPATERWVAVPSSGWIPWENSGDDENPDYVAEEGGSDTYLIFDPAVSPHFQLVQLWLLDELQLEAVHIFSSVTGEWRRHEGIGCKAWIQWGIDAFIISLACPFNGMLQVGIRCTLKKQNMIVAVDGEGKPSRIMHWPDNRGCLVRVGRSQGHLHCLSGCMGYNAVEMTELSIWVLEDYNAEKWVLRDNVSLYKLFERMSGRFRMHWDVIAIHPDCGLVFFVDKWNWRLISYDMDTKEVRALCTLGHYCRPSITPYVPCFMESEALAKKN